MQLATQDAVDAIKEITGTIRRISEIAAGIAAAVEQQGATTTEISRNVAEAAKGTAEVASSVNEVSKGASDTGSASSQVLSSAKSLSSDSRLLKLEVEKFLSTVRAPHYDRVRSIDLTLDANDAGAGCTRTKCGP